MLWSSIPPIVVLVVMDLAFLRFGDARGNSYVPGTATGLLWRSAKLWRIGATFSVDRSCGAQISRHSAGLVVVGDFWIPALWAQAMTWIVGIWSKWYKLDPWKVLWKGGGIFPRNKVPKEPGIGDLVSASNFHESDGWSHEICCRDRWGIPELQLHFIQRVVWWMISFNLSITRN